MHSDCKIEGRVQVTSQLLCSPTWRTSLPLLHCNLVPQGPKGTLNDSSASLRIIPERKRERERERENERENTILVLSSYPVTYPEKTMPIELRHPNTIGLLDRISIIKSKFCLIIKKNHVMLFTTKSM